MEARTVVVEFRDDSLNGLYEAGNVKLGRHLLSNPVELLRVLVHEVCHEVGGDGEKSHEVAEGRMHSMNAMRLFAKP